MSSHATLEKLFLYPIKGMAGCPLSENNLEVKNGLIDDRRFGLCTDDPDQLQSLLVKDWEPWKWCANLKFSTTLASIQTLAYDQTTATIQLTASGETCKCALLTQEGKDQLAEFVADYSGIKATVVDSQHQPLWDYGLQVPISIINLASIAQLGKQLGTQLDQRRFRGNLMLSGLEPWVELSWQAGTKLKIDDVILEVTRTIARCKATKVNPDTAEVDVQVPNGILENYGHKLCGVGATVVNSGKLISATAVEILN